MLSKDTEHVLQEGTYDFVIGPNWGFPPEFDYEMLYHDPYVLVVPDRYDIEAYAEYKDENVMPFVDLRDLPPMDYVFQMKPLP